MRVLLLIFLILSLDSRGDTTLVKFWAGLPGPSEYYTLLLTEALDVTQATHGGYHLETNRITFSSGRSQMEMSKGEKINIKVGPPFFTDERELITIPVAIDKGLLGYRVLIIRATDRRAFDAIHNLDDLRKQVVIGQELGWMDTQIYQDNGISVITTPKFEFLGKMLINHRFDAIPLGIEEADYFYSSLFPNESHASVYDNLVVYYDMALAFQVSKNTPELAVRVEAGLQKLIASGRFDRLFRDHYKKSIEALSGKRIICLQGGAPFWSTEAKATLIESTAHFCGRQRN